jgi:hydroxymethylpyrimidine/phosphomethylpyrimidine kinase
MSRPLILTIAGFDPSSGAGLSADLKTIEQLGGYGLAICSALTLQTENEFASIQWRASIHLKEELTFLLSRYPVNVLKTGILPSTGLLKELLITAHALQPHLKVVVDPVMRSTTGQSFSDHDYLDAELLRHVTVLTPNLSEWSAIENGSVVNKTETFVNTALYLKSVDNEIPGVDELYIGGECKRLTSAVASVFEKHGSGCVLASAIATELAKGATLEKACTTAKCYTETFLNSHPSKLGYHAA